jgi:hypothetical protein
MNRKHRRTLAALFETPVRADIEWTDIEALVFRKDGAPAYGSFLMGYVLSFIGLIQRRRPTKEP